MSQGLSRHPVQCITKISLPISLNSIPEASIYATNCKIYYSHRNVSYIANIFKATSHELKFSNLRRQKISVRTSSCNKTSYLQEVETSLLHCKLLKIAFKDT